MASRLLRCAAVLLLGALPTMASAIVGLGLVAPQTIEEFVNDQTGRRILLTDAREIEVVLSGVVGGGWRRSGLRFQVRSLAADQKGVCRFYAPSVNAHFFTQSDFECDLLRNNDLGWYYEGIVFNAIRADSPVCPVRVYRLYGEGAHRYTADPSVRARLAAKGYYDEGAAFCVDSASASPYAEYTIVTDRILPSTECEDETKNLGPCVGLNQLPLMPYGYDGTQALGTSAPLPGAPPGFPAPPSDSLYFPARLTGVAGYLYSPVQATKWQALTAHSFVTVPPLAGGAPGFGIYVNSRDFVPHPVYPDKLMSANPLYQFRTTPPADGEPDLRVMPWRSPRFERTLELSFDLRVAHVRRQDDTSHAICHLVIELLDTRSGRNLYITLAAAQTVPVPTRETEDYFALDVGSRKVIVSTSFRANPAFGTRLSGEAFQCDANSTSHRCAQTGTAFAFRLSEADLRFVIAKARRLDPRLSAELADYAIDNFSFNNELTNDAELGLSLINYRLRLFEQER